MRYMVINAPVKYPKISQIDERGGPVGAAIENSTDNIPQKTAKYILNCII